MKQAVVTVCSGTAYSVEYVKKLETAVERHSTQPFSFYVIADDSFIAQHSQDFVCWRHEPNLRGWWPKLELTRRCFLDYLRYSEHCTNLLYFDLDMVICGNIDGLFYRPEPLLITRNYLQPPIRNPNVYPCKYGSATISMNLEHDIPDLHKEFLTHPEYYSKKYEVTGDQHFIEAKFEELYPQFKVGYFQDCFSNPDYFRSVKYPESINELSQVPVGCSVLAYHGDRKPHKEPYSDIITTHWR